MKKFLSISTVFAILFSSLLVSCDTEETYSICRIEIAAEGCGHVQFEGHHGNSQKYNPGNEVVIIAHPDDDYSFDGWYTKDSETPLCTERRYTFTANEDISLTARFVYKLYSIKISNTPGGRVYFENKTETSLTLPHGREITAVAKAYEGYTFIGWYKENSTTPVSPQPIYRLETSEEIELIAKFEKREYIDGHEYIDLGLPSGTLWATCNVGASEPEEYGGYYAWGETEEKDDYSRNTYKWCNGSDNTITKYCTESTHGTIDNKTALEAVDDVACAKWGGNWKMPSNNEQQELIDNCIWSPGSLNRVDGYWVTSKNNGKSIFLPAAGCRQGKDIRYSGTFGYFWSGELCNDNSNAHCIRFYNGYVNKDEYERSTGFTVRPVYN